MTAIPFLTHTRSDSVVAYRGARAVAVRELLDDAARLAGALPASGHVVNLCADRYRFAVGLCAALLRDQVSLLPPGVAPELLRQLAQDYPGLYAIVDGEVPGCPLPLLQFDCPAQSVWPLESVPAFPPEQVVAMAFTSGSTGRPTGHLKRWGSLSLSTVGEAADLGLAGEPEITLLGTVPAQHMYGLETTVLMALQNGFALHAARPFYPADIREALEQIPGQRVLVTTPVHLRALLAEEQRLSRLRLIVCATASLSPSLASQAEQRYGAPVMEIYGFTEAGQVAWRRTTAGPAWRTLPGVRVRVDGTGAWFGGGPVEQEVLASDVIEAHDERTFTLQGRNADLVNIAGKRTSLAYLNHQLLAVGGVLDGTYFAPDREGETVTRLTAFVVAPGMDRSAILTALRTRIDPVFLPRPLHLVDALPRNATGKLPREALADLARQLERRDGAREA